MEWWAWPIALFAVTFAMGIVAVLAYLLVLPPLMAATIFRKFFVKMGFLRYMVLANLALFMAALGVYGLLSFVVTSRMRELGVRTAVGAQRLDLVSLIAKDSAVWVICGLVAGFALSVIVSRSMTSLIYGIEPLDWISLITSTCVLGTVAGIAALLPVWRATQVDPMTVLRSE